MMSKNEVPLLNMAGTVHWRDRWWLLDIETSGLDRQADDITALRLACMENRTILDEREIRVRPRRPLRPWIEQVTGISNQTLEQALPLEEVLRELEKLDGPLLLLDRDFGLPFLRKAFSLGGREFHLPCLLLDRLAALLLGGSPKQKTKRFLEKLPLPSGWTGSALRDRDLNESYQLALAEFEILEGNYRVYNTSQLADFYRQEDSI